MKIRLNSDFHDFYDHHFAGSQEQCKQTFERLAHTRATSKRQQFNLIERMGFETPRNGRVVEVAKQAYDWRLVNLDALERYSLPPIGLVVYHDEYAHCGEGKELYLYYHATHQFPRDYCSEFIWTDEDPNKSISQRLLYIGERCFWLQYTGIGGWKSNHAETVDIQLLDKPPIARHQSIARLPLIAVDFVTDYRTGKQYGVDFNQAPGVKGTPIEDLLKPKEVYELIEAWIGRGVCAA